MSIWERLGDMMVAMTFAEAGEAETAIEMLKSAKSRKSHRLSAGRQRLRKERYAEDVDQVLIVLRERKKF